MILPSKFNVKLQKKIWEARANLIKITSTLLVDILQKKLFCTMIDFLKTKCGKKIIKKIISIFFYCTLLSK
jgi:hypothetical protein